MLSTRMVNSPLHIACEYGHLEIVKVFLKDKKCDLDIQDKLW